MQISVLQWNVWYKEDIRNIASFLAAHPAGVICLQELTLGYQQHEPDTIAYIAQQLGYHSHYQAITHEGTPWKQANGIFSRFPIVATDSKWINEPTGTGHYDDQYRAYIEARIAVGGKELTIATTHMSYTNAFVNTSRKEQEAEKLARILKTKKRNFIFTGDLNAAPNSPTVQAVADLLKNIGPDFEENTWTTKPFAYDGFEEAELRWRLDYMFATNDIQAVAAKVINTDFSDHLPIIAHLNVS